MTVPLTSNRVYQITVFRENSERRGIFRCQFITETYNANHWNEFEQWTEAVPDVRGFQDVGKAAETNSKTTGEFRLARNLCRRYCSTHRLIANLRFVFLFWFELLWTMKSNEDTAKPVPESEKGRFKHGCPLDKDELGRSTWNLLHTMAATYPDKPTTRQSEDMVSFFGILSQSYPCDICAKDLVVE